MRELTPQPLRGVFRVRNVGRKPPRLSRGKLKNLLRKYPIFQKPFCFAGNLKAGRLFTPRLHAIRLERGSELNYLFFEGNAYQANALPVDFKRFQEKYFRKFFSFLSFHILLKNSIQHGLRNIIKKEKRESLHTIS